MKKQLEVKTWEAAETFRVIPQELQLGLHRYSAACAKKFETLKDRISGQLEWRFATVHPQLLRQAVNEAAALAATTPFPTLFLPALAEEKALLVSHWERKQRMIQERSFLEAA